MTFCRISLLSYEELCMKQFSIKNKSCKVLFSSDIFLIASITNYMYAKFFEVWTIIFKIFAFSGYSGVLFTRRSDFLYLFAGYFFWWNGNHGLKCGHCLYKCNCNTHIYRIFCHVTLRKTRFKIALYFCATVRARKCIVSHTYLLYFSVLKI